MFNVNNKIKQASGQNWGKPTGADKKASEKGLRNDLDEIQSESIKTFHKKKSKSYSIGEEVWIDVSSVTDDNGKSLSTIMVKTPEGQEDWHSIFGPKEPGKTAIWFLGKYLIRIESVEINKRSKKSYYRGEILDFEPKYKIDSFRGMGNKGGKELVIGRKGVFKN